MSTSVQPGDASSDGQFEKRVEVVEKDEDEQIATAAALVPDRLDHQGDFLRADTIAGLAEGYQERFESGEVYPGVMHSVFPDEGIDLVESRVLEDAETIGEKDLPAGTWLQRYQFSDDELWELVDDEILGGISIGGTAKGVIYEPGAMPDDVEIPDAVEAELDDAGVDVDEVFVREITEGRIMETSQVDHPAVPDAVHADTKALAKGAPALTENVVASRLYLEARGHDADDARRLAEYLDENKSQTGLVDRAKSFFGFGGAGGGDVQASGAAENGTVENSDESAESDTGSDEDTTHMSNDDNDINEKLEALDERLTDIDEKLSEAAEGDGSDGGEEKDTDGGDEPSVEEKVDRLAEATVQISEQVEQMADAQGVSQQADQGTGTDDEKSIWGEGSPFGGDA